MANFTTTQQAPSIKELLDTMIYKSYEFNCETWKVFKKELVKEEVHSIGRYMNQKVKSNQSYGSQATEGGAFPASDRMKHVRALVGYRSQFASFGFTGDVEDTANIKTQFDVLKEIVRDTTDQFDEVQNFFLFGTGNGALGVIDSVSTNDLTMLNTVANPYGARMIREGQLLNAYDQSGSAYRSGDMTVNSVARGTDIVSVDTAAGSIANDDDDILVFKGSYNYAPQGLAYHIADSGTWLGLSRTTYPSLKSIVHDAASASIDQDMIDIASLKSQLVRGNGAPKYDHLLIMHDATETAFRMSVRSAGNVQFNADLSGNSKMDLSVKKVAPNGMKIHIDQWCAPSDVWGVRLQDWAIEEVAPRQLYKHNDGNIFIQQISGSGYADAKEGRVYARYNLVCKNPSAQFRIKNINFNKELTRTNRS